MKCRVIVNDNTRESIRLHILYKDKACETITYTELGEAFNVRTGTAKMIVELLVADGLITEEQKKRVMRLNKSKPSRFNGDGK